MQNWLLGVVAMILGFLVASQGFLWGLRTWLNIYLQNEKVAPEKLAQKIFHPFCDCLSQNGTQGGAEVGPMGP